MTRKSDVRAVLLEGRFYERRTDGSLAPLQGESDWARVDAMTDWEIDRIAAADEDSAPMTDEDWARAPRVAAPVAAPSRRHKAV